MSAKLSPFDLAELAASADIRTRRANNNGNHRAPVLFAGIHLGAWAVLGIAALGLAFYFSSNTAIPRKITDPDSENFSTTSPIPPTVPPEQVTAPEEDSKFVVIKPDVAPPPPLVEPVAPEEPANLETPPPITAPTAPVEASVPEPVEDNSAALAAEAERLARLKSPLIVFDNGEEAKKQQSLTSPQPIAPSLQQAEQADLPVAQ